MQQIWSATGRRKRASAQVRIASPGTGTIQINQVDAQIYLQGKYPNIRVQQGGVNEHKGGLTNDMLRNVQNPAILHN